MKNNEKWLLVAVMFVGLIIGATLLYNNLSKQYTPQNLIQNEQSNDKETNVGNTSSYAARDFTVTDWEGNKVNLSDFFGKPIVLNFWATWCYYCVEEMPDFNKAYAEYPDVQFLMINATDGIQETLEKAKQYVENENFDFNVYFDTELDAVSTYGVTGFPCTYFIDSEGNLVTRGKGLLDYETIVKGISMITNKK